MKSGAPPQNLPKQFQIANDTRFKCVGFNKTDSSLLMATVTALDTDIPLLLNFFTR